MEEVRKGLEEEREGEEKPQVEDQPPVLAFDEEKGSLEVEGAAIPPACSQSISAAALHSKNVGISHELIPSAVPATSRASLEKLKLTSPPPSTSHKVPPTCPPPPPFPRNPPSGTS